MIRFLLILIIFLFSFDLNAQTTWDGSTDTDWADSDNWSAGVPDASDAVTIPGSLSNYPSIDETANAASLTINSGGTVTISKDGFLTVAGAITNNGTLTVVSDANESGVLIAKAASNPSYTFTYYVHHDKWKLISPVVTGEIVNDIDNNLATNSGKSAIGKYDGGDEEWDNYTTGSTSSLLTSKGYQIRYASGSDGTVNFSGTMVNADRSRTLEDEGGSTYGRWHCIGNPFPSYIHLNDGASSDNFIDDQSGLFASSYSAVYAWDGSAYDIYNNSSGAMKIAPGEGFFIYIDADGGSATFTEASQTSGGGQGFIGRGAKNKNSDYKNAGLKIKMTDSNTKSTRYTKIFFNNKSTLGLDEGYDAGAIGFYKDLNVYTRLIEDDQGINMGIQSLPYSDMSDIVVPIGIDAKAGEIALVVQENTIPYDVQVYLEDKNTGKFTAFDEESNSIKIQSSQDLSGTGRFFLHFNQEKIDESNIPSEIKIYAPLGERKVIVEGIKRFEEDPTFTLYNVKGEIIKQRILNKENGTETIMVDDLSGSVYIVNLNFNSIFIKKKIIIE